MPTDIKTAGDILAERIRLRLVDVAKEMTEHKLDCWKDIKSDLLSLTADDFQVIYSLIEDKSGILELIEETVNDNTNDFAKDVHGEFSFGEGFLEMYDGDMLSLISFDPEGCTESKKRNAALTVIQYFQVSLTSLRATKPGRPYASGFYCAPYGAIQSHQFDQFAFTINGALEDHALPETFPHHLVYDDEKPENKNKPQSPSL